MVSKIYYFSGTGNCLAVAKMINEKLTERSEIIPIKADNGKKNMKADRVGFVFPVYCHKIPKIVKQFILGMEFISIPYLYAVATHNGEPGQSLFDIQSLLAKKGQSLSLGIGIEMPGNAILTEPDVELKRLSDMEHKVIGIVDLIESQKEGIIEGVNSIIEHIRNSIVGFFAWNFVFSPNKFKISNNCSGCGICVKLCPINNINLVNNKPKWINKCATCLACFHWCPKEAIYMNNSFVHKRRKYHHPNISINDMF